MLEIEKMMADVIEMQQSSRDRCYFAVDASSEIVVDVLDRLSGNEPKLGIDLRDSETGEVFVGLMCDYNDKSEIKSNLKHIVESAFRNKIIPRFIQDGITKEQISNELDYRDRANVNNPKAGWDDALIDYTNEELELAEDLWEDVREKLEHHKLAHVNTSSSKTSSKNALEELEEAPNVSDKNTKIKYLYRDADNYMVHNECIINGVLTSSQRAAILDCLDEGEFFIPSLVGMPEVKFDEIDDPAVDHQWFELREGDFEETTERSTVYIWPDELVSAFCKCKDKWMDIYLGTEEAPVFDKRLHDQDLAHTPSEQGQLEQPQFQQNEPAQTLSVKTKLGDIVVTIKDDPDYPGVCIDLKGTGLNDRYQKNTVRLAWVEFEPEKNKIQTLVYGDGNEDDFTHLIEHEKVMMREKDISSMVARDVSFPQERPSSLSEQIKSASDRVAGSPASSPVPTKEKGFEPEI